MKVRASNRARWVLRCAAVALVGAALVVPTDATATGPGGCEVGAAAASPALAAGLDLVSGGWIDTFEQGGAPQMRATIVVRSLPSALPAGAAAARWTMDFHGYLSQYPGVFTHPFMQAAMDPSGGFTGVMGYIQNGQRITYQPATVNVVPGTPGYITIERDADTLSIAPNVPLTDFTTTSELVGAGVTTADAAGPFPTTYLADVSRHTCVDLALPAQPTARSAAGFLDSIGVNTHLNFAGFQDYPTRSGTYQALGDALLDLGIHHIRETWSGTPAVHDELERLGTLGIKTDTVFSDIQNPTVPQAVDYIASLPGAIDVVEGDNEPADTSANLDAARQFQKDLYAALKADPRTASLPVGTPAMNLSNPQTYAEMGDLSDYADYGALHAYSWAEPYARRAFLDPMQDMQRIISKDLPIWVTEAGWDSFLSGAYRGTVEAPEVDYCNTCVSERAQAGYMTKMLLTNYAAGIDRTYMYELIDEGFLTAPTAEDYYGLIRADLSPKPVYDRLKTLNRLLSDTGSVPSPGSLTHTVGPAAMQHLLLQKSDGSFWLALWKDDRLYASEPAGDAIGPHDLTPAATTATLTFGSPTSAVQYQLANGTTSVGTLAAASTLSVSVPADDVTLLKLSPGSTMVANAKKKPKPL